eukprot:COSAG01_NODE_1541_length_9979_cov_71.344737_6_plen_64_part_00
MPRFFRRPSGYMLAMPALHQPHRYYPRPRKTPLHSKRQELTSAASRWVVVAVVMVVAQLRLYS